MAGGSQDKPFSPMVDTPRVKDISNKNWEHNLYAPNPLIQPKHQSIKTRQTQNNRQQGMTDFIRNQNR